MTRFVIQRDHPESPDVHALLDGHLAWAHQHSPPSDVHALDDAGRTADGLTYFSAREKGTLLGVAALHRLDQQHAELKSMHTAAAARRTGVARALLAHVLEFARAEGYTRVSLETGSMEAFAPARLLYAAAGFRECAPFGKYVESPYSAFMTLQLCPNPADQARP
jgi:putative acetyltransferase